MSSLIRRIGRQVVVSHGISRVTGEPNPARQKFYGGRGSKLGTDNPKCKARIARLARDKKWGRK